VISAAAAVACGADDDSGGDDDRQSGSTIECEDGTVGQAGATAETDVRITRYDAQLTIADAGGDLTAAETITVQFDDSEHHGIFRDFSGEDYPVSDATGTLDGAPSGSFTANVVGGRLTLGDADVTLPAGEHDFGVSYSASDVLRPATDVDQDVQFDAAVLSSEWALDIAGATVTIALPSDSGDVSCIAGPGATASVAGAGTSTLVVTAGEVPAGSGVRVLVGVDGDPDE
jgi:hypothetical protein